MDNIVNVNAGTIKSFRDVGDPNSPSYNPDYYYRSVLGLISEGKKGQIFNNIKRISRKLYDELPYEPFDGLDFGFSSDPAAVGEFKHHNGKLFARQLIYERGLDNDDLAKEMKIKGVKKTTKVYADSAEPKSISTLNKYGFSIIGAIKGADSIEYGYRELLTLEIYLVEGEDNEDFEKEFEEHSWALDKDKNPTDKPEDSWNHLIDAMRYAVTMAVSRKGGIRTTRVEDRDSNENGRMSSEELLDSLGELDEERKDQETPIDEDDEEDFYEDMGMGYDKRER